MLILNGSSYADCILHFTEISFHFLTQLAIHTLHKPWLCRFFCDLLHRNPADCAVSSGLQRISCTGSASMRYVTFRWRCVVTYFPRFTWPSTDRISRRESADPIRASPLQSRIPPSLLLPPRCKDPHLRPRGRRAMPRNGKYCDTPSAPASDPGLRPRRRQSDVRSHFPASKYRIRSPSISAESPDPALPAHCTDGIPGSAAAGFLWLFHSAIRFPSHFDFKRLIKKTPAPVFLQTAGVSLRLNTNHATA